MKNKFLGYKCSLCGREYSSTDPIAYACPNDGGNLNVFLDYDNIKKDYQIQDIVMQKESSMWRYLPLLPVFDPGCEATPLRIVGWTPNYSPTAIAEDYGLRNFWVKDESRNPSASFKDRASALVIARAREINAKVVVTASTGNAGAALAGMAAAVGHKAVIFAPRTAPPAKIAQLLVFGAQVILVEGSYDQAFDLSKEAANEYGWYCRNTGYNAFTAEGKKTAAFEIWETFLLPIRKPKKPAAIFISVGDGNIISGIHKGFLDLQKLGWLEVMPRLFGVQSDGSAAVANAYFNKSEEIIPVKASTLADSISVDLPRDGVRALRAATQTGGSYITVPDSDILSGIKELGQAGIFSEPAGAAAFAGFKKALSSSLISVSDDVIVLNTGSGLKDINSAMKAVTDAPIIEPSMEALKHYMETHA